MKNIMVFGTFDRLHPGHRFVLEEALKRGSLTIIVARSVNVKRIKGRVPVESDEIRAKTIQLLFPTATVLLGDPQDFLAPVRKTKPDLILLGYDQTLPPGVEENDMGCPIERLPAYHPTLYKSSLRVQKRS